ncbi:MAG: tRNA pseudouridine(38-40) synthase TruA [Anaerolineae bacterium]
MRLRCAVEYDGTDFAGWQRQLRARSVQGALEEAIEAVTGEKVNVVGAGRTDAGVHATGQVAHFDTEWDRSTEELGRALNAVLPLDCAIRELGAAPPGFHARHSATGRAYAYTVWVGRARSPLLRRTALHVLAAIDPGLMQDAGRRLVGEHDFGAFGQPMSPGGSTVRRLTRLDVRQVGRRVIVELEANAFLRHQVRRTVGLLLDVGRGAIAPDEVDRVVARLPDAPVPRRVPACGLVLVAVRYDGDDRVERGAADRRSERGEAGGPRSAAADGEGEGLGGAAPGRTAEPMSRDRNTE